MKKIILICISILVGCFIVYSGIKFSQNSLQKKQEIYNSDKYLIASGTVERIEYVLKPNTFGPDIEKTILYMKNDRIVVIDEIMKDIILNKPIKIYKFNWKVWYKEGEE